MVRFLIHRPKWIVAVAGILFFLLTRIDWLTTSHLWQKAEGMLIDRRYLLRGTLQIVSRIKLVGLGTSSFKLDDAFPGGNRSFTNVEKMQQPWPWDR